MQSGATRGESALPACTRRRSQAAEPRGPRPAVQRRRRPRHSPDLPPTASKGIRHVIQQRKPTGSPTES
uniref:Uncharacterized protein n=1 Tax=Oryza rufipogon TaxID=4529 RepID=A0A0E0QPT2_ORYRU